MGSHVPGAPPATAASATPTVPLTLEGSWALHQMMRIRHAAWRALSHTDRAAIAGEAAEALRRMGSEHSAVFSMVGHKGDLMFVHFRRDLAEINRAEIALQQLRLWDYLEPTSSYVSVIELGLYESTQRIYRTFSERGSSTRSPLCSWPFMAASRHGPGASISERSSAMSVMRTPGLCNFKRPTCNPSGRTAKLGHFEGRAVLLLALIQK